MSGDRHQRDHVFQLEEKIWWLRGERVKTFETVGRGKLETQTANRADLSKSSETPLKTGGSSANFGQSVRYYFFDFPFVYELYQLMNIGYPLKFLLLSMPISFCYNFKRHKYQCH